MTRNNKGKLSRVWHWKDLPEGDLLTVEGYDALMAQRGKTAEEIEERFAAVKAQPSIRAQRAKKA